MPQVSTYTAVISCIFARIWKQHGSMIEKLESIKGRYLNLEEQLSDPEIMSDNRCLYVASSANGERQKFA